MHPRAIPRRVLLPLFLALSLLNMATDASASHDCCGHPREFGAEGTPAGSSQAAKGDDGEKESGVPDDVCACFCCQADTLTPLSPEAHIPSRSGWTAPPVIDIPPTLRAADIFHPPLS